VPRFELRSLPPLFFPIVSPLLLFFYQYFGFCHHDFCDWQYDNARFFCSKFAVFSLAISNSFSLFFFTSMDSHARALDFALPATAAVLFFPMTPFFPPIECKIGFLRTSRSPSRKSHSRFVKPGSSFFFFFFCLTRRLFFLSGLHTDGSLFSQLPFEVFSSRPRRFFFEMRATNPSFFFSVLHRNVIPPFDRESAPVRESKPFIFPLSLMTAILDLHKIFLPSPLWNSPPSHSLDENLVAPFSPHVLRLAFLSTSLPPLHRTLFSPPSWGFLFPARKKLSA